MTGVPAGHRVTRFYTLARRFPTLVGRLPNGSNIPYGPYTVGQLLAAVTVLVGGYRTMPLWGGGRGLLANGPTLLMVTASVIILMRKMPWRGRGPLPVLRGAFTSYGGGCVTYKGKPLPARQAAHVNGDIVIAADTVMEAAAALLQRRVAAEAAPVDHLAPAATVMTVSPAVGTAHSFLRALRGARRAGPGQEMGPKVAARRRAHAAVETSTAQTNTTRTAGAGNDLTTGSPTGSCAHDAAGSVSGLQRLRQQARTASGHAAPARSAPVGTSTARTVDRTSAAGSPTGPQKRPLAPAGFTGRH